MEKNSIITVKNELKGGNNILNYVKISDEEHLFTITPLWILNTIMQVNNSLDSSSNILKWNKSENNITGGSSIECHGEDSKNNADLYVNEKYSTYVAKKLGLLKPLWEEGKYNSLLVELMLQNFTISDIIQVDKWIRNLFYEKTEFRNYVNGIPYEVKYPVNTSDEDDLKDSVDDFFKNNNVSDSLKNGLGRLLVYYCLYHAFDV